MDEREAFLENYSRFLSAWGQGDTAGKLLGLLMINSDAKMTLDDLTDLAGRAKSTVHTAVKNMTKLGLVRQTVDDTPSEGRNPYLYYFNTNFFEIALRKIDHITDFKQLIAKARDFVKEDNPEDLRIEEYNKILALYTWWEQKLRENFKEWEKLVASGEYRQFIPT